MKFDDFPYGVMISLLFMGREVAHSNDSERFSFIINIKNQILNRLTVFFEKSFCVDVRRSPERLYKHIGKVNFLEAILKISQKYYN